jgi:Glucodextranase, domain N
MTTLLCQHAAPRGHGIAPRWTRSDKDGVGTAYSGLSRVWFTVSKGILNEVYYPTIDRPQIRDLQYLITDGELSSATNDIWTTLTSAWPRTRWAIESPTSIPMGATGSSKKLSPIHIRTASSFTRALRPPTPTCAPSCGSSRCSRRTWKSAAEATTGTWSRPTGGRC